MRAAAAAAAAVVSCFVFVGCAQVEDGVIDTVFDPCAPLAVDGQGSDAERASIDEAIAEWNGLVGAQLVAADDAADADVPVVPVVFQDAGDAFHGLYDDVEGVVYINDSFDSDRARSITIAHELGHAFGLLHVDVNEEKSVMNHANLVVEPNAFDRRSVVDLWGSCR